MNGLDLGGFRLTVDLLSKQTETIANLFEQLCPTTTTAIASSNKNDPRLANAPVSYTAPQPAPATGNMDSMNAPSTSTPNAANNKEDRESMSNAVASLPPAQVRARLT